MARPTSKLKLIIISNSLRQRRVIFLVLASYLHIMMIYIRSRKRARKMIKSTSQSSGQSLKRKAPEGYPIEEDLRVLSKMVASFFEEEKANTCSFSNLKNSWEQDFVVSDQNTRRLENLYSIIEALGGTLSRADVIKATRLISQHPAKVALFYSMSDDESKLIFVAQELGHV